MGKAGVILAVLVSAVLCGCAALRSGPEASPLTKVKVGMSPAQVESLLGRPPMVEPKAGEQATEVWHYNDGIVILRDDEVVFSFPVPAPQS